MNADCAEDTLSHSFLPAPIITGCNSMDKLLRGMFRGICTPAVMPCMAANATSLPAAALQNKLRKTSVPAYISAC